MNEKSDINTFAGFLSLPNASKRVPPPPRRFPRMNDREAFEIALEEARLGYQEGGVPVS